MNNKVLRPLLVTPCFLWEGNCTQPKQASKQKTTLSSYWSTLPNKKNVIESVPNVTHVVTDFLHSRNGGPVRVRAFFFYSSDQSNSKDFKLNYSRTSIAMTTIERKEPNPRHPFLLGPILWCLMNMKRRVSYELSTEVWFTCPSSVHQMERKVIFRFFQK